MRRLALLAFASLELRAVHELTLSCGLRASLPPARSSAPPAKSFAPVSAAQGGFGHATTLSEHALRLSAPLARHVGRAWLRPLMYTAAVGALLAGGYAWRSIATSAVRAPSPR